MSNFLSALIAFPIALGLSSVITLYRAWVLVIMWAWFVIPVFPSAPTLTTLTAFGLLLVLNVSLGRRGNRDQEEFWKSLVYGALGPSILLCIGWVAQRFI